MKPCPFCGGECHEESDWGEPVAACTACEYTDIPLNEFNRRTPGLATRAMLEIARRNRTPPVEGCSLTVFLVRISELEAFLDEWKDPCAEPPSQTPFSVAAAARWVDTHGDVQSRPRNPNVDKNERI